MIGGLNKTSPESFSCALTFADTEPLLYRPGAAVLNKQLYYCGGLNIKNNDKCFKNVGGNWVAVPSMNEPKYDQTMTTVGSYILVTGGVSSITKGALDTVEIEEYPPVTRIYEPTDVMV